MCSGWHVLDTPTPFRYKLAMLDDSTESGGIVAGPALCPHHILKDRTNPMTNEPVKGDALLGLTRSRTPIARTQWAAARKE